LNNNEDKSIFEKRINVEKIESMMDLFGNFDENINIIESEIGVSISTRDTVICITGEVDKVTLAAAVIERLLSMVQRKMPIDRSRIRYAINLVAEGKGDLMEAAMSDVVAITYKGKQVKCRTVGQKKYIDAIKKNTIVLCVGPAGTGKT
jgi:phosphate starvation-inducible PhoH-like protein